MALYKIMIVDDEAEVREAIVKKMDWESLGFSVVADAENGIDALEKAETLDLDLILTDIKMPFMDGLELGKALQERHSPVKLILFSGFDDFEFAKEAIKLNVIEYVLKPVNAEELGQVLSRVKQVLDQEIEERRSLELLKRNYQEMLPVLKERFLSDLIRGIVPDEEIEEGLKKHCQTAAGKPYHVAAVGRLGHDQQNSSFDREMVRISVGKLLSDIFSDDFSHAIWVHRSYLVMLVFLDEEDQVEELISVLEGACKRCQKIFNISLTVGIGNLYKEYDKISTSYAEARQALEYRAILGSGSVIYHPDVDYSASVSVCFDEEEAAMLTKAVTFASGEEKKIEELVGHVLEKVEESDHLVKNYQVYMIGLLNAVVQLVEKYGLSQEKMLGHGGNYLDILSTFRTPDQLSDWLCATCVHISRGIEEKRVTATRNIIDEAKEYIGKHYADPELSVDKLCRQIHLSPSYFSTIFKQETGKSYVNYLTEIRMEKAVELLNTTENKTYLIASMVGYPEANYFSYVFKKTFGVSPSKYRNR